MLRRLDDLTGCSARAIDGEIGDVYDFYFDDRTWTVRYVVLDTGGWLAGRLVLISPESVGEPDWEGRVLPVNLTREQIEGSPPVAEHQPISLRMQEELARYYGWAQYWGTFAAGGAVPPAPGAGESRPGSENQPAEDLRSVDEVTEYRVEATDGEVGGVCDMLADPEDWAIRYLIIDTRRWLHGREVIISPAWVQQIEWDKAHVHLEMSREMIEQSPEYDLHEPLTREYEEKLHAHYKRTAYWE